MFKSEERELREDLSEKNSAKTLKIKIRIRRKKYELPIGLIVNHNLGKSGKLFFR